MISYTPGENLTYPDSILIEDFIKQFGDTLSIYWSQPNRYWSVDPNGAGATLGLLADTLTSNHDFHYLGHITDEQLIRPGYSLRDSTDEISSSNSFINTFHDYNFGSWLVRNHSTSVPEPSSFNLLLLGLLALAYRKYR